MAVQLVGLLVFCGHGNTVVPQSFKKLFSPGENVYCMYTRCPGQGKILESQNSKIIKQHSVRRWIQIDNDENQTRGSQDLFIVYIQSSLFIVQSIYTQSIYSIFCSRQSICRPFVVYLQSISSIIYLQSQSIYSIFCRQICSLFVVYLQFIYSPFIAYSWSIYSPLLQFIDSPFRVRLFRFHLSSIQGLFISYLQPICSLLVVY